MGNSTAAHDPSVRCADTSPSRTPRWGGTDTAPLIDIRGLTVDFDAGHRVVRALHGVDLAIQSGEAVGLVGESGSGKSVT